MKTQAKILVLLVVVLMAMTGCTNTNTATPTAAPTETATDAPAATDVPAATDAPAATEAASAEDTQVFTAEELKTYNGKDGAKAYVAVDGVVYDVTDVPAWANGEHNGLTAGEDVTDAIKNQSPHGVSALDGLTVAGTLK